VIAVITVITVIALIGCCRDLVMTGAIARDRMPDTRIYIGQQLISTGEFGDTTT